MSVRVRAYMYVGSKETRQNYEIENSTEKKASNSSLPSNLGPPMQVEHGIESLREEGIGKAASPRPLLA